MKRLASFTERDRKWRFRAESRLFLVWREPTRVRLCAQTATARFLFNNHRYIFRPKVSPSYARNYLFIDFPGENAVYDGGFEILRRRGTMAVGRAKSKTVNRKHASDSVVQFKRSSSSKVRPSLGLRRSHGGDPGPSGFDWKELKPF